MRDFAFYNVGCDDTRGLRAVMVFVRRLARRILRPIFLRQAEIFHDLANQFENHEHRIFGLRHEFESMKLKQAALKNRQDELDQRQVVIEKRQDDQAEYLQTTLAFGWDYVALVRRLAILEDQLATLTGSSHAAGDDPDIHPSILFPGIEKATRKPASRDEEDDELHSKVS